MLQRTQLRHDRHQTWILTLHPNLLPDPYLLASIDKNAIALVVFGEFGREAEALAE